MKRNKKEKEEDEDIEVNGAEEDEEKYFAGQVPRDYEPVVVDRDNAKEPMNLYHTQALILNKLDEIKEMISNI